MRSKSLVSIIIPTFNRAHIIKETLDTIVLQSYSNWECIIVDDGSSDDTISVVQDYMKTDSRFKFFSRPKHKLKGANSCRNYGFEKANGEFINWFDSDDIMHSDFLKAKVELLEKETNLDFCACISSTFKNSIEQIQSIERPLTLNSKNYIEDYLLNGLYFYTPSPLWRFSFLEDKMYFDESLHRSQESDFHFRMLTHNPKFKYIDRVLFYIRVGADSISTGASISINAQKSIFKYFDNVFDYLEVNKTLKNREKLMSYVFYRQATNYYNINQLCNGIFQRFGIYSSHAKFLINYMKSSKTLKKHFAKVLIGIAVLFVFKKGYKYFYFPEYNYAKK
jgi:glycosyltransferase involved in cell wall biosynthesis